jgi:hypothetical protein
MKDCKEKCRNKIEATEAIHLSDGSISGGLSAKTGIGKSPSPHVGFGQHAVYRTASSQTRSTTSHSNTCQRGKNMWRRIIGGFSCHTTLSSHEKRCGAICNLRSSCEGFASNNGGKALVQEGEYFRPTSR